MNTSNAKNFIGEASTARKAVSQLVRPEALLPVVLLEATCTSGRTYQGYKRDGIVEAREKFIENALSAAFWFCGATGFNKLFDAIGIKFMNMPKQGSDVAYDAVRKPTQNLVKLLEENEKKINRFKVGKIAASLVAAWVCIGVLVPKLYQAITKSFYKKQPQDTQQNTTDTAVKTLTKSTISIEAVNTFKSKVKKDLEKPNSSKSPSFKSGNIMGIVSSFETNHIYKLIGTDVGMISGRAYSARNNDERIELVFRDVASAYFYCFATYHVLDLLSKKTDKFKGFNTGLNPKAALEAHNYLVDAMNKQSKPTFTPEAFKEFALGKGKIDNDIMKELFSKENVVDLEKYKKAIRNSNNPEILKNSDRLIKLGEGMSGLQPGIVVNKTTTTKIITKSQVEDIFIGGEARNPEFMKKVLKSIYGPERLTGQFVFISQKDIEKSRKHALNYVESIAQYAEKSAKDTKVDWSLMKKVNKRNLVRNGVYWGAGFAVSALFLSTLVPKLQYWITKKRTGQEGFPGIKDIRTDKPKD